MYRRTVIEELAGVVVVGSHEDLGQTAELAANNLGAQTLTLFLAIC